ncbi:CatA-like O-acetyltransferase [Salmonella enterica subsp. enterica serovar Wilhelmsburg]|uniref:CatA-like O-acetyltransferase n=1 Tax=Salmonella enterica subsp. enterica serovar Wilhelmsburg TaxID=1960126 RepID=A0A659QTW9_SALET|nr:CatA-like O-acetyltransferase, family 1 [Salmonella enterica]TGC49799.1 CatA-like O-acetyltransferase [Salmonella enterica subsp. enterica serovar Wilhelmsburg]TGC57901.1 CatA-like O-acetyltransferase [Salmonella enterica subsp. enterica serovar Wilhelmsburg]TGC64043.1 CatA-like O-acetyltransferase [Salmonella enterica subsp. enterica serovar Wilhelmsburg]TGC73280.1 CatA-like O-acetyltransferase [Salmonella enterica subsp. enterica serovar Wilhelmsburg]TGC80012.1 CatA-like O-acetyltransfera
MNAYKSIDKEGWSRAEHYKFYSKFDNPCFNLCVPVNAQKLYDFAKDNNESFFQLCLFAILRAANTIPELKQRTLGDEVIEYNNINVMTPIITKDEGFRQVMCESTSLFSDFKLQISEKIDDVKNSKSGPMIIKTEDFFCASCLPWLHFSSITHAELHFGASVPTLTWGKLKNGIIPVACKFNHAFVDGLHASRFFAGIEDNFGKPDLLYLE